MKCLIYQSMVFNFTILNVVLKHYDFPVYKKALHAKQ